MHDRQARHSRSAKHHHPDQASSGRWKWGVAMLGAAAAAAVYPHIKKGMNGEEDEHETLTLATTINRPAQEIYDFWMGFQRFDEFIPHVKSVIRVSDRLSAWTIDGPGGQELSFTSTITDFLPGESIHWRVSDSVARHEGKVTFSEVARGTIVLLELQLQPPMGPLGRMIAMLMGKPSATDPKSLAEQALERLKQLLENGEAASGGTASSG